MGQRNPCIYQSNMQYYNIPPYVLSGLLPRTYPCDWFCAFVCTARHVLLLKADVLTAYLGVHTSHYFPPQADCDVILSQLKADYINNLNQKRICIM